MTKDGWKLRVIPNLLDMEDSMIQLIRIHAGIPNHDLGDLGSKKQAGFFCSYCFLLKTSMHKLEDIEGI